MSGRNRASRKWLISHELGRDVEQPAGRFRSLARREDTLTGKDPSGAKRRGGEMFAPMTDGLLGGLLSGLEVQGEMSDLLEEIYYESLR
jgi:hypothetical protein